TGDGRAGATGSGGYASGRGRDWTRGAGVGDRGDERAGDAGVRGVGTVDGGWLMIDGGWLTGIESPSPSAIRHPPSGNGGAYEECPTFTTSSRCGPSSTLRARRRG